MSAEFVFVDCETTGLDPRKDVILEVAVAVVSEDFELLSAYCSLVQWPPLMIPPRAKWSAPVQEMHSVNGLADEIAIGRGVDPQLLEEQVIGWLTNDQHLSAGSYPMCGSSVHFDRHFLYEDMPKLEKWFHYRDFDVSTVKQLAKMYAPGVAQGWDERSSAEPKTHRALDDIEATLREMRFYRDSGFIANWRAL